MLKRSRVPDSVHQGPKVKCLCLNTKTMVMDTMSGSDDVYTDELSMSSMR